MITIHGVSLSPFARKVLFGLEYKEIAYEQVPVFPGDDSEAFSAISPLNKIPVIEDGGVVGSISEARILDILVSDPAARSKPVAEYMEEPFPVLPADASINMVAQHMKEHTTAVLVRLGDSFDIITKYNLHGECEGQSQISIHERA